MLKPLIFLFLFIPAMCFAQFSDDFEDADITNWTESTTGRWAASDISPINGAYSLHHIFDNPSSGRDQISVELPVLNLNDTVIWKFRIQHGYNPSSSNNWSVFLLSDADASEMYPSGSANGYAIGVNYTGSTDTLKFWKVTSGSATEIFKAPVNWQDDIGTSKAPAVKVLRTPTGLWNVSFNADGDFNNLTDIGSGTDTSYKFTDNFGIYYEYSSSQDQKLWIDDIEVIGKIFVDTISPVIDSLSVISSNEIYLKFNENIDSVSAVDFINYSMDGGIGNPDSVYYDGNSVNIFFPDNLSNKQYYNISIQDIKDLASNLMDDTTIHFLNFIPEPYDIVINEIMADPTPEVNLPGYEYIEILNTTEFNIDLTGWKLKVGSSERDFADIALDSAAYLTLCSATAAEFLDDYGAVMDFSSFPAITNSGTSILVIDENSTVIDSINFTSDWYKNTEKEDGGWSIEKIDPLNNCSGISNWKASEDTNGGTPGQENSVLASNIDTQAPQILSLEVVSVNELRLIFNEPIEQELAQDTLNYSVNNSIGNPSSAVLSSDYLEVDLIFSDSFIDGDNYILTTKNLIDFCGNTIPDTDNEFVYYTAKTYDVVVNEIFADPDPVVGLPEYEFLEIYNTSSYDLNLSGWKLKVGSSIKSFPDSVIKSDSYAVLCNSLAAEYYSEYGDLIVFPSFPSIPNTGGAIVLYDNENNVIDSVNYNLDWYHNPDKNDGGWSIEKIDPLNNCSGISNWKASEDTIGGTPGQENSVFASNIDTESPIIADLEVISNQELKIFFNEPIEQELAQDTLNYSVNNSIGNPSSAVLSSDDLEVDLIFSDSFIDGENYILTTKNLIDFCGNAIPDTDNEFVYYTAKPYDVVVNEIFADPDPVVGLPEYEFLEIYNTSSYDLNLSGWKLKVGSSIKSFPDSVIKSDSYAVLCNSLAAEYYSEYGDLIVFPSFPSIPNTGGAIVLYDNENNVIDSVNYNLDWYHNPDKNDGGWSIEKIDPLNNCSGISNWKASEDTIGGTPGQENSVLASNIDTQAPQILSVEVVSGNELKLFFNEPVDQALAQDTLNYIVNNSIGNPSSAVLSSDYLEIDLIFSNSFIDSENYILTTKNLTDFCGNTIPDTDNEFVYYTAKPYDVVVNEIFADPDPVIGLPEYEFLEIYNTSSYDLNLSGWKLKVGSSIKSFPDSVIKSDSYAVLCNSEAAEYYSEYGDLIVFSSFPSIPNTGGAIVLYDEKNTVIDSVNYNLDWYQNPDKNDGGWSIEKIEPLNNCSGISNWKASEDADGGTPGQENSVLASNIDTQAPQILSVEVVSGNELKLFFNEPIEQELAQDTINYSVNNGIGNPSSAVLSSDYLEIDLIFSSSFIDGENYILTTKNLTDFCGNAIPDTDNEFVYYTAKTYDVVVNEIFADPDPVIGLPEYEFLEIYNTSSYDLNLSGWKLKVGSSIKSFPDSVIKSDSYAVLCHSEAAEYYSEYGDLIVFPSFPSIPNTGGAIVLYDEKNTVIDSVNYNLDWYQNPDKNDGGWSIEKIDPLNNCSGISNWASSENSNGGTPGMVNSIYASNIDNEAPQVNKVEIVSGNQLKIYFSEPLTNQSILEKTNYEIDNGIGNPFSIMASDDLQQADLLFLKSFPEKVDLTLTTKNLTDNCGNASIPSDYLLFYYTVQPYDIVLNEIMANPEPTVGLPEYEYLEIYNRSDFAINLKDWTLQVGSTLKTLSEKCINSNDYLILTSSDADSLLKDYGDVLIIPGFPNLANTGQSLVLKNTKGQVISQISYTDEWYRNELKAEGGWSLEQIDPSNPCTGENNWIASESETGGTPGQENSVMASNPDIEPPKLLRITVIDDQNIQLFFNETIDSISARQTIIYKVDHDIGNPVSVNFVGVDYKSIALGFSSTLETNVIYNLNIRDGIYDCAGNEIGDKNTGQFAIPSFPKQNDLVINEILFNPLPGGYDFVEIYNRSEKTFDLKDVLIASYDDERSEYNAIKTIASEGFLIFPGEYIVLTENPEVVKMQYATKNPDGFIKLNDLPAYNDDKGRVMLLDKQQNVIDNFAYNEDMHFALLATNEGVSLERINYDRPTDDKTNWHSASELVGFATPAYKNSQFIESEYIKDEVTIEPEVFSPDNDGFKDITTINFTFDEPGYVVNIKIYDSRGRLIRYLANNQLLGIDGVITWDGLDDKNQKAPVGIYVVFIEVFDLNGNVKQYKKSVVVAAKW